VLLQLTSINYALA